MNLKAPFPYFGGKRTVVDSVWGRLGKPKQYIEPFCGSLAMLLGANRAASLEVVGDQNLYIANFWRAVKFQPDLVWAAQDYPVSHVDLDARHRWLTDPARTAALLDQLRDAEWPGDAKIAGWWVWGQCAWIGSGWCEKTNWHQIPSTNAMEGTQAVAIGGGGLGADASSRRRRDGNPSDRHGKIPHTTDGGRGLQRIREREREREREVASGRNPFCRAPAWGCKRRDAVLMEKTSRRGARARWTGSAC